ncbi:hypothetical protein NPIL_500301 [Nephila pilipes]|uniref:Uncharacterized protein n=1 Tax=Nephila pilipes TaxID=299642 RepID=A0A8X6PKI4_NEPPI|nr:hypothetical protein NPIL_500301 [Nephila pilipes]
MYMNCGMLQADILKGLLQSQTKNQSQMTSPSPFGMAMDKLPWRSILSAADVKDFDFVPYREKKMNITAKSSHAGTNYKS